MPPTHLHAIYFSATETTHRYIEAFTDALGYDVVESVNLADNFNEQLPPFSQDDLMVIASPVYCGRLPEHVADCFRQMSGNGARAIAFVVYGNRDYDDALLELVDLLSETGFKPIAAGAFIGRHSIFPKVAAQRPDKADIKSIGAFAHSCRRALEKADCDIDLKIPGNRPYKKIVPPGLVPHVNTDKCIFCGRCVDFCPVGAINSANPCTTDSEKCIACGRCIKVCSSKARKFSGFRYRMAAAVFQSMFSKPKDPSIFV